LIGTGQLIEGIIRKRTGDAFPFSVVSNPEFLREGSAIEDFMRPDRVVIGARDPQAVAIMKDIYSPLYLIETPFVITNVESSELIKPPQRLPRHQDHFINEAELRAARADVHHVAKGWGWTAGSALPCTRAPATADRAFRRTPGPGRHRAQRGPSVRHCRGGHRITA
jgi:UDPglucose 6-dehydrogenase